VEFSLDTPEAIEVGYGDFAVNGWCFSANPGDQLQVHVLADTTYTPAFIGLPRPDVARHYGKSGIHNCGFVARFRCPKLGQPVSLVGRLNDTEFVMVSEVSLPVQRRAIPAAPGPITSYKEWLEGKERDLYWREDEIESRSTSSLAYLPLISIILPTYNTPPYFLKRCLESVMEQRYVNWQLCITDDQSSDKSVFSALRDYALLEPRIHLERSVQQGGISAASNSALKNAKGDFVVLLDHDDELHPHALLELARAVNAFPKAQFFYSDEDKIDQYGVRSQPAFKPDFDENIFLSFNYLGHMIALKRSLVMEIGGFRSWCDGAQDWDLLIRAMEVLSPSEIKHIRKPLYHWRMHGDSTSFNLDAKPYVANAWARVLQDHVQRKGKKVAVTEGLFYGSMRLKHLAPEQMEIGVFLRPEDGAFQASVIKANTGRRVLHFYQIVESAVFQMNPGDERPEGQPALCSLTELKGDVFVFINGPLESLSHLFFEELASQAMRRGCPLATGISLDSGNRILASGYVRTDKGEFIDPYVGTQFPRHGYMGQINVVRSIDACSETFFAVQRKHLAECGGLGAVSSSGMHFLARELSLKARQDGLSVIFTPYAVATFSESCQPSRTYEANPAEPLEPLRLNPQILAFQQPDQLLRGNLE